MLLKLIDASLNFPGHLYRVLFHLDKAPGQGGHEDAAPLFFINQYYAESVCCDFRYPELESILTH
jgi:hypothetical protein